jgi:hypothetical protein
MEEKDVGKAKLILNSLLKYLSQELDQADIETPEIDSQLKSNDWHSSLNISKHKNPKAKRPR